MELPINSDDNTLGLQTLKHAFPNAHGLKFKNPATGTYRALLYDLLIFNELAGFYTKVFFLRTKQCDYCYLNLN